MGEKLRPHADSQHQCISHVSNDFILEVDPPSSAKPSLQMTVDVTKSYCNLTRGSKPGAPSQAVPKFLTTEIIL